VRHGQLRAAPRTPGCNVAGVCVCVWCVMCVLCVWCVMCVMCVLCVLCVCVCVVCVCVVCVCTCWRVCGCACRGALHAHTMCPAHIMTSLLALQPHTHTNPHAATTRPGFVLVKKVPGTLHFTSRAEGHSFDHAW
jgi:hypothetical protein